MDKLDLKNAFREAANDEFRDIPAEDEIDYTFSDDFDSDIAALVTEQKTSRSKQLRLILNRAAIIALVVFTAYMTAGAAYAGGNPFFDFFVGIYQNVADFIFPGAVDTGSIVELYAPTYVPEGFTQDPFPTIESTSVYRIYEKDNREFIHFFQATTDEFSLPPAEDIPGGHTEQHILINGCDVTVYIMDGAMEAQWARDAYRFTLSYFGDVSQEEFIRIVESVSIAIPPVS